MKYISKNFAAFLYKVQKSNKQSVPDVKMFSQALTNKQTLFQLRLLNQSLK